MSDIVTDLGQNINWKAYKVGQNDFTITCTNGGSAFNLSPYTFTCRIRKIGTTTDLLTLTQGSGVTNGGATGIITISLTETQANVTLPGHDYFYELTYVVSSQKRRMIQGSLTLSDGTNPASTATSLSATINMAGTNINAAISIPTAPVKTFVVSASDETTAITAGTGKVTFRMPYAIILTAIRASLTTAQTSGSIFTVDVNENGTSILSTKLTIDNGEKTTTTAATAAVLSDTSIADDAEITIDVDQVGDGTAKGLKIAFIGI